MSRENVNDLLNQLLSVLNRLLAQISQGFDLVNVQIGVTSAIELIIDFE